MATETKCDLCGVEVEPGSNNRKLKATAQADGKPVNISLDVSALYVGDVKSDRQPGTKPDLCTACFGKIIKKGLEAKPDKADKES